MQKVFEKVPASDVSKKVEYLLNTGNLVSQSGLDLNQVCIVSHIGFVTTYDKPKAMRRSIVNLKYPPEKCRAQCLHRSFDGLLLCL